MESTTTVVTVAEDVRLDLGQTDLVGSLEFDGEGLVLVAASGTRRLLAHALYQKAPGDIYQAPADHILVEEVGRNRTLPAALVGLGCFREVTRHKGFSAWGADVVELRVLVPVLQP